MKYVILTRVSDIKQKDGTSPETQLKDCIAYCEGKDYVHFHEIQKGGLKVEKRKILISAIEELEAGDVLLCTTASRLARSTEERGIIKYLVRSRNATLEYACESSASEHDPSEWLQEHMMSLFAQFEKIMMGSRIRRAHKHKRENNEVLGYVCYGYKKDGNKLVKDDEQQKVIDIMRALRNEGLSYRAVVKEINERGHLNSKGNPWDIHSVFRILKRAESTQSG